MKKLSILVAFALSISLLSCEKKEKRVTITATTEYGNNEKTFLERHYDDEGDEYFDIKWEIGDGIGFIGWTGDGTFEEDVLCVDNISSDGRTAYLYGNPRPEYITDVFYPSIVGTDYHIPHSDICVIYLDPYQVFNETRIVSGFPMAGVIDYNTEDEPQHINFFNLCGLLRITIKDGRNNITRVKKVKISSNNEISGYFERPSLSPTNGIYYSGDIYTYWEDTSGLGRFLSGQNFIELSCSYANNGTGVPLASDGTDFYFYVPPTMMNDMVIEVTNMDDEVATKDLSGHNIQVMRSQLTGIKVDFTNVPFI